MHETDTPAIPRPRDAVAERDVTVAADTLLTDEQKRLLRARFGAVRIPVPAPAPPKSRRGRSAMRVQLNVRIEASLKARLFEHATATSRDVGDIVATAIAAYIDTNGAGPCGS